MSNKNKQQFRNAAPSVIQKPVQVVEQKLEEKVVESETPTVQEDSNDPSVVTNVTSSPEVIETKEQKPDDVETYFNNVKQSNIPEVKNFLLQLESYAKDMKAGVPVSNENGAKNQYALWKAISYVSSLPMDKFRKAWNLLLVFSLNNKCFDDRYIYRFSEYWIWSTDELDAFQRIINLIKLTAKHDERQNGLKQVSLDRSLEKGFTQESKQNIIAFYS